MEFKFPLARETDYKATISFRAIIEEPLDQQAIAAINQSAEQARRAAERAKDQNVDSKPTAADLGEFNGWNDGRSTFTRQVLGGNSPDSVTLYLPQAIQFRDGAQYDNVDLGAAGGVAEAAIQGGSGLAGAAMKAMASEGGALIDAFKSGINSGAGGLAAVRASKFFGDTAQNVVKSAVRVTTNPNTRSLFKSVAMREFTFQFKLIPETKKESESIKNIIKWFRTELYPESIPVTQGGPSIGYRFPNKMDITMMYNGKPIPMTKMLPSYLRDITVTYNSNGMSFFEGGDFTSVDLSLSFMEARPLTKAEIKTGVY